ncbi:MAG TPA: hypothetical protein VJA23_03565 [Candidatus Nanoarchaeia archaeon]|nr:hypothetical protein [Candidatus Nanoarchaeia archaeon]
MFAPSDESAQRYYSVLPSERDERGYQFVVPVSLSGGLTDIFTGRKRTLVEVLPTPLRGKLYLHFHNPMNYLDELQQNLYK